jgi:hypothetical protein
VSGGTGFFRDFGADPVRLRASINAEGNSVSTKIRRRRFRKRKISIINLDIEFEGRRAFAICDRVPVGHYEFKVRLELDPRLLEKVAGRRVFVYHGEVPLPKPEEN